MSAIDVLESLGWLAPVHVDMWRQGRVPALEDEIRVDPAKLSSALSILAEWAARHELVPSEGSYIARTRDRRELRFSAGGDAAIEHAWRTHWMSPSLSDAARERLERRQRRPPDLVVIWPLGDWECSSCGGTGDLLMMEGTGPVCRPCADLDHLVFLPAGDAALSRRAKQASGLSAVVVRFSRARKRYERQGILVEEEALALAEEACLADEEARRRRREREEERRARQDDAFRSAFAAEIRRLFPGCAPERATAIAAHAGQRGSGRVGRTAAGRELEEAAVTLAVVASVRHRDTRYDQLLMAGTPRFDARERVRADVDRVLGEWRRGPLPQGG